MRCLAGPQSALPAKPGSLLGRSISGCRGPAFGAWLAFGANSRVCELYIIIEASPGARDLQSSKNIQPDTWQPGRKPPCTASATCRQASPEVPELELHLQARCSNTQPGTITTAAHEFEEAGGAVQLGKLCEANM